jgi:hypothetical protein
MLGYGNGTLGSYLRCRIRWNSHNGYCSTTITTHGEGRYDDNDCGDARRCDRNRNGGGGLLVHVINALVIAAAFLLFPTMVWCSSRRRVKARDA